MVWLVFSTPKDKIWRRRSLFMNNTICLLFSFCCCFFLTSSVASSLLPTTNFYLFFSFQFFTLFAGLFFLSIIFVFQLVEIYRSTTKHCNVFLLSSFILFFVWYFTYTLSYHYRHSWYFMPFPSWYLCYLVRNICSQKIKK